MTGYLFIRGFHEKPMKLTHFSGKCQIWSIARYSWPFDLWWPTY